MLRTVLEYSEMGISMFPLRPRSKQPLCAWSEYAERRATEQELRQWFDGTQNGVAGVMGAISGYVAIDADCRAIGRDLYRVLPRTSMMTLTPRGVHFLYRLREGQIVRPMVGTNILGHIADLRGERSYVALPLTIHPSGKTYEKIGNWNPDNAPFFDESWIDAPSSFSQQKLRSRIKHVSAYLQRVESIQGERGSAGLIRAVSACRDGGLSESEATVELLNWNQLAGIVQPPWSIQELTRAITRVYRNEV